MIQRKENWKVRAVPCLCQLYPGICLTAEEKARKNNTRAMKAQHKNNEAQYKNNEAQLKSNDQGFLIPVS
jgi:hypothetical protein